MRCYLFGLLCLFWLMGCAGISQERWQAESNQQHLNEIRSHWQAVGKFSLQATGVKPVSASVKWCQQEARYSVSAFGPFGLRAMRVRGENEIAKVQDTAHPSEIREGKLMDFIVGTSDEDWQWSANNMSYWLVGLPAPGDFQHQWDGQTSTLVQSGWQMEYQYQLIKDVILPNQIIFTRLAPPDARMKLLVSRWLWGENLPACPRDF